jgi:hypothetical protein
VFFLPRRVTTIIKSGGNMSLELTESIVFWYIFFKRDFLPNGAFFCSRKSRFFAFFRHFFGIGNLFFSGMA